MAKTKKEKLKNPALVTALLIVDGFFFMQFFSYLDQNLSYKNDNQMAYNIAIFCTSVVFLLATLRIVYYLSGNNQYYKNIRNRSW